MNFQRKELLDTLNIVKPGLASKDLVEELTCNWFQGDTLYAYNDLIGIQIPFKTDFTGGLRGSLLLGLLDKSRAKEVSISPLNDGNEMLLKAANTRLTLALLEQNRALWEVPEFDKSKSFVIGKDFLLALENVLISIGGDTSIPDQLGVTLLATNDTLDLFTTDNSTISWYRLPKPKGYNVERVIIPAIFCEQLLRLCKDGAYLVVTDEAVMAQNSKGIFLFSRLIESQRPLDLADIVASSLPETYEENLITVPSRLKLAIERVNIVLENHVGQPADFYIEEGSNFLRLYAKTDNGEIKDSMKLDQEHSIVRISVDPTLVKRALNGRTQFLLTDNCFVLAGPGEFIHLISTSQSND
jgi:DNA polymerase III sliding clamp (beta) subunit (PCNA family)